MGLVGRYSGGVVAAVVVERWVHDRRVVGVLPFPFVASRVEAGIVEGKIGTVVEGQVVAGVGHAFLGVGVGIDPGVGVGIDPGVVVCFVGIERGIGEHRRHRVEMIYPYCPWNWSSY